jgi:capsular polysaccharide biosynthesis protein
MELREYWRTFKRRAWIPILLLIVTTATAGALTFLSKPQYVATAHVSAKNQGASSAGAMVSFTEVATSFDVVSKVIKQLSLNETPASLSSRIKVTSGRSSLYGVSITDPNPDQAVQIANAVATEAALRYQVVNSSGGSDVVSYFDQEVKDARALYLKRYSEADKAFRTFNQEHPGALQSKDLNLATQAAELQLAVEGAMAAYKNFEGVTSSADVARLDKANVFSAFVSEHALAKPDTVSRYYKMAYAAALALLLGIGLIFVLEYMDTAIRLPEAAEEMIGAPVVGIIPRANASTLRPAKGGAT